VHSSLRLTLGSGVITAMLVGTARLWRHFPSVDGGTSWGAPFDGATFHIGSWSDTAITFPVPIPSGPGHIWHVNPGDTAVTVNTSAGPSNTIPLQITG